MDSEITFSWDSFCLSLLTLAFESGVLYNAFASCLVENAAAKSQVAVVPCCFRYKAKHIISW